MHDQERELKVILNKEQAEKLIHQIQFEKPRTQINTYYDSPRGTFKEKGIALRIRHIVRDNGDDEWILTIKKPLDAITKYEYEKPTTAQSLEELAEEDIAWIKSHIPFPDDIEKLVSFKTERRILELNNAEVSLDHTFFANHDDYEIEYEYRSDHDGIKAFNELLKPLNVQFEKNCLSKLARAVLDKKDNSK